MSRSSSMSLPIPLRISVGAMCEMIPPAPTQNTEALENAAWSKPGISRCRSSAPGIALPLSLIEVCETVDARCMFFHSRAIDFDIDVLVQPDEPDESVAAEYGHHCHVAGALQAALEILINSRWAGGVRTVAGVAVEVRQQPMSELLKLNEQLMGRAGVSGDANEASLLVRELRPLVEHERTVDLIARDEEELFVLIGCQLLEA